jgi:glycosyltransferase involved in cell wall biosynthesis
MPVFKANPEFLNQSLESIISQSLDEIELLVILDRSNTKNDDSVLSVIDQFLDDHRIKLLVNKRRLGLVHSLNQGIKESTGNIIARMDCDDISLTSRLEEELDALNQGTFDIIGCWAKIVDENNFELGILSPPCEWRVLRKSLLFHNPFLHPTIMFKKKIIDTVGLYDPYFAFSEDYEFLLRIFSRGFKGNNIPRVLHLLREHSSSIVRGNTWKYNRIAYLKCKLAAVFKYNFRNPIDIAYLAITPFSFLLKPQNVITLKKYVSLFQQNPTYLKS